MSDQIKVYQIYAKEKCIMDLIPENEFEATWKTMNAMVGLMKTDYNNSDLSYREIYLD
jgi:hypothetical protein